MNWCGTGARVSIARWSAAANSAATAAGRKALAGWPSNSFSGAPMKRSNRTLQARNRPSRPLNQTRSGSVSISVRRRRAWLSISAVFSRTARRSARPHNTATIAAKASASAATTTVCSQRAPISGAPNHLSSSAVFSAGEIWSKPFSISDSVAASPRRTARCMCP